jgi:Flp pilus assembly protein CpaB
LILIAAIAVGALAAFAIFNYVGGIEDRANQDARRVPVIRVSQDIPRGLTGQEARDQGYLEEEEIASEFLPRTAISPDALDTINAKQSVSDFATGQVLVEGMFVDPVNAQVTAARRITTGNVAITISVDDVRGVAGLIVPGDFINMMAIPEGSVCGGEATEGDGAEGTPAAPADTTIVVCNPARVVYQGVQVLFVDRSPIPLPGEAINADPAAAGTETTQTGLLTLSVPPAAAQLIASVGSDQWYLTLVPPDYTPAPLPAPDPFQPNLPGEDGNQLTPYGPEGLQPGDTP